MTHVNLLIELFLFELSLTLPGYRLEKCKLGRLRRRRHLIWYYATSLRLRGECHIQNLLEQLSNLAQFVSTSDAI
jgi:hypothetical protein